MAIDALSAFNITYDCIRRISPDYREPPFAIRYQAGAAMPMSFASRWSISVS